MLVNPQKKRARLSIDLDPELRRKIKVIAAEKDLSIRDYVAEILQRAVAREEERNPRLSEDRIWSQISSGSFARDWASEEDTVYDHLPQG